MKRAAIFVLLIVVCLTAWWVRDDWWPLLRSWLLNDDNATLVQVLSALAGLGAILAGYFLWIGRLGRTESSSGAPGSEPEREVVYVTERDFTPSPITSIAINEGENPYLGLRAFQREDTALFFGREREIGEALAGLGAPLRAAAGNGGERCRWLQVEGNSGAGKSSLVNAGLLPRIEAGALAACTGFSDWRVIGPVLPGEKPLRRLAEALQRTLIDEEKDRDTLACQHKLEEDVRALSYMLADFGGSGTAFVLVLDQFEELFTFSDPNERRHVDAQLAYALQDAECPLFLIGTVRVDFLHGFEHLPQLSELYNSRCQRYLLKTISREGLREAIERPAAVAGLDVSEVTEAMLSAAENEPGALPLVENALKHLWERREGNRLSGALYTEAGGLFGMFEAQADALLDALDHALHEGKARALELLLALTRVSDQGNHSRRRLSVEEARQVAAGRRRKSDAGQAVIDWLAGRPGPQKHPSGRHTGDMRLVTVMTESGDGAVTEAGNSGTEGVYVDLIHEMLIRPRSRDPESGRWIGYWRTLYAYIERHRDRSYYRDRLARQAREWQDSRGFARWRRLAGWADLWRYRWFHPGRGEVEYRYKWASGRWALVEVVVLAIMVGYSAESYLWTLRHGFPPSYALTLQKFRLASFDALSFDALKEPLPEVVDVPPLQGTLTLGERDAAFLVALERPPRFKENFGVPRIEARIEAPFAIGITEVTYEAFDYYVWSRRREGMRLDYPAGAPGNNARGRLAVANVSWNDASAYLAWLSEKTGDVYRLPTEAEWEYAARAGTDSAYWWHDELGSGHANCDGCGSEWDNRRIAPVAQFAPNAWGLYDTAGNVWEWTCSVWQAEFDGSESRCAQASETASVRALRGGSWVTDTVWVRSSSRNWNFTGYRYTDSGFRVLRAARAR